MIGKTKNRKIFVVISTSLFVCFGLFVFFEDLFAQSANISPKQIDFSAYVMGRGDQKIINGEHEIRFALYLTDRTEADPYPSNSDPKVWEETQTIEIKDGILKTYLGLVNSFPADLNFSDTSYYLGIRIGSDSESVPRKRIGAAAVAMDAFNAKNAESLQGATLGTDEGNILQLGADGKIDIDNLPTGTSGKTLVLANDSRLNRSIETFGSGTYLDVSGMKITLNQINLGNDVTGILGSSGGGTGVDGSLAPNGSLLIGNGKGYTLSTILAGDNITIGNGSGSIEISSVDTDTTYTAIADNLLQLSGTEFSIRQGTMENEKICTYNEVNGLVCTSDPNSAALALGSAITGGPVSGSVLFIDSGNALAQNNSNLFWDEDAHKLGIGTSSPSTTLQVNGVITASGGTSTQWNTAFGWGDHSGLYDLTGTASGLMSVHEAVYDHGNFIALTDLSSSETGLAYNNATGVFSLTGGYVIPTTTQETNWNTAYTHSQAATGNPHSVAVSDLDEVTLTALADGELLLSSSGSWINQTLAEAGIQASHANLASLSGLSYASTAFVKMTGANTFTLDTNTYLTSYTETDPIFTAHQAYNIDAADITNLGNLSGTNTGDVTLSNSPATYDYLTITNQAITLNQIDLATDITGTLPVGNGGTGTTTQFTQGSIIFAGSSGVYSQDNSYLFWDSSNNRLGIGTASPTEALTLSGNQLISPTGTATSGTQYASYDLKLAGSSWITGAEQDSTHTSSTDWNGGTLTDAESLRTGDDSLVVLTHTALDELKTMSETLPYNIQGMSCAENSATNKIYCFGGHDGSSYHDEIVEYDSISDSISTKTAVLPQARFEMTCVQNSATNNIYCFGGRQGSTYYGDILEYNSATDTLTTKTATLPRSQAGMSCVENSATHKIYCVGGYDGTNYTSEIIEYDPAIDTLTTKTATLPRAEAYMGCAEDSSANKIYCLGGQYASGRINEIIEYVPATDTRSTKSATLPRQESHLVCAEKSDTNDIYCFGGYGTDYVNEIIKYDPGLNSRTTMTATLPAQQAGLGCAENSATNRISCLGAYPVTNQIIEYPKPSHSASGTIVGTIDTTQASLSYSNLSWTEDLPAGTDITIKLAYSDDDVTYSDFLGPDGTTGTSFTTSSGEAIPAAFDDNRYIKYQVTFTTSDTSVTSVLSDITVSYIATSAVNRTMALRTIGDTGTDSAEPYRLGILNNSSEELFSILGSGKVGIGTASPDYALDVSGQVNATGGFCIGGDCIASWETFNSKQDAYANLTSIGMLGDSAGWLYNNGSGIFSYATPSGLLSGLSSGYVPYATSSTALSSTSMYYSASKIGINTTSPQADLEVRGSFRFSTSYSSVQFSAPSLSSHTSYIWPDSDGDADQVLTTDGMGNLSWSSASGELEWASYDSTSLSLGMLSLPDSPMVRIDSNSNSVEIKASEQSVENFITVNQQGVSIYGPDVGGMPNYFQISDQSTLLSRSGIGYLRFDSNGTSLKAEGTNSIYVEDEIGNGLRISPSSNEVTLGLGAGSLVQLGSDSALVRGSAVNGASLSLSQNALLGIDTVDGGYLRMNLNSTTQQAGVEAGDSSGNASTLSLSQAGGVLLSVDSGWSTAGYLSINSNQIQLSSAGVISLVSASGVGVGTDSPSSKFEVSGGDIRVTGGSFIDDGSTLTVPDYVFEPDYDLMSIDDLEDYILKNKHLPGIPDMDDKAGWSLLSLQDRDMKLLEKTEENSLYIIQNKKEIDGLVFRAGTAVENVEQLQSLVSEQSDQAYPGMNDLEIKIADLESQQSENRRNLIDLQDQIDLIKTQSDAVIDFWLAGGFDNVITRTMEGNLDLSGGQLIADGVVAGAIKIKIADPQKKIIGQDYIEPVNISDSKDSYGEKDKNDGRTLFVRTAAVNENSKIFVTPKSLTEQPLAVTEVRAGEGFKVEVKHPVSERIVFDWWIIEGIEDNIGAESEDHLNGAGDENGGYGPSSADKRVDTDVGGLDASSAS